MSEFIHQPQDKLFKSAMKDIRVAREFFQHYLPDEIKNQIDFKTLSIEPETFIEETLKLSAADCVYKVSFNGKPGYLFLLLEQQTKPDYWIPLRLMQYILCLLYHYRKQHPDAKYLPVIYPIIFYNGQKLYPFTTDFCDLFGPHKAWAKSIWTHSFQLIDLQTLSDDELRQQFWCGILGFVLKHQKRDFLIVLEEVLQWLHKIEKKEGVEYAKAVMYYIIHQIGGMEGKNAEILLELARKHSTQLGGTTMTFAQYFEAKGKQRGIEIGMEKGLQKGKLEGKREEQELIARRSLANGIEPLLISKLTGLSIEEIENLETSDAWM